MSVVVPVLAVAVGLLIVAAAVSHTIRARSESQNRGAAQASVPDAGPSDLGKREPSPVVAGKASNALAKPADGSGNIAALQLPAAAPVLLKPGDSSEKKIDELDDFIQGNSPEAEKLRVAMATLLNPDKKVRAAALEHVKDLDDRDAVPGLEELAAQTDDPDDKAALLDVAEFLNLPSFSEYAGAHPGTKLVKPAKAPLKTGSAQHAP
jgi:hypothetical protein